jgi:hypothetical protein
VHLTDEFYSQLRDQKEPREHIDSAGGPSVKQEWRASRRRRCPPAGELRSAELAAATRLQANRRNSKRMLCTQYARNRRLLKPKRRWALNLYSSKSKAVFS